MALETVQAVRQAELKAEEKEREALQKKEAIITQAKQNATTIVSSMTKEAMVKAELELNNAIKKGEDILEASRLKANNEVNLMKEMVKEKEQSAIHLIFSNLL